MYRKLALKVAFIFFLTVFFGLLVVMFLAPKPFREVATNGMFVVMIESLLLLTALYLESKVVRAVSILGIAFSGIIGAGLITTNQNIVGLMAVLTMILAPTLFLAIPLLIIYLGIKSISSKETIVMNRMASVGDRLESVSGPDAVGMGVVYIIVGFIFLLLVLALFSYAACGDKASGWCVINQPIQTTFDLATRALGKKPILTLAILASAVSGIYSGIQYFRGKAIKQV